MIERKYDYRIQVVEEESIRARIIRIAEKEKISQADVIRRLIRLSIVELEGKVGLVPPGKTAGSD